jgi:hypothetical protein
MAWFNRTGTFETTDQLDGRIHRRFLSADMEWSLPDYAHLHSTTGNILGTCFANVTNSECYIRFLFNKLDSLQ